MRSVFVNFEDVVGNLCYEYNLPVIKFDDLIELGKRAVIVYNLDSAARRITFEAMCHYITLFIKTPFGKRILFDIVNN